MITKYMTQTSFTFQATRQPCYLFFDTETTGLPKNYNAAIEDLDNWPRLVQIAWLTYGQQGQELNTANYIIRPDGFEIPTQASDIHGITTARALLEGLALEKVMAEFITVLNACDFLVAHNMSYDIKIIEAECLRLGLTSELANKTTICTKELATDFCALEGKYGYKWPKLSELHIKLFDSDFEAAHDALVDVRATARCFWELKNLGVIK